jgi:two-component SAPR family response regulator
MKEKCRILIINSNIELIQAFEEWVSYKGCLTHSLQIYDLKTGRVDLKKELRKFNPDIILYDVSIPYKENFDFFKKITEFDEAKDCKFILTTTNKRALDAIVGKTKALEVLGKPFDLDEVEKLIITNPN